MIMKGQFFLIGAVLLIILFFLGLPFISPSLTSPSNDLPFLSENLKQEFPAAYNLGLNQSDEINVLKNWSIFLNDTFHDHLINFTTLWITSYNVSNTVNFTIGNYLGGNSTVNLTISSTTESVSVPLSDTGSVVFSSPGSIFNLTILFNSRSTTVEWLRDKKNLFVFYQLRRGNDILVEELSA